MPISGSWDAARATRIIADHSGLEGPVLPIFHALQAAFGYVPAESVPLMAEALNLSRAELHGVLTFYHDFREKPAGRHVLKICRAEACQSLGGEAISDKLLNRLDLEAFGTTPNGALTIEAVYCLGLCATAPAALLDGKPLGRLTGAKLDAALAEHSA